MDIEAIKVRIKHLYESKPLVHINVSLNHPKIQLRKVPVKIKEIYPHVFRVEEIETGKHFTLQYTDVLIGRIEILEFNNVI